MKEETMKEGKFYEHIHYKGWVVLCVTPNPIFFEGIAFHDPDTRKLTGEVEFFNTINFKEYQGSILITTI